MKKIFLALAAVSTFVNAQEIENSSLSDSVDLSTYKEIQKHQKQNIIFDANTSNVDGLYNYKFSPNNHSNKDVSNSFVDGNFEKIYRYDSLYFDGNSLEEKSDDILDTIMKQVHTYTDDKSRNIAISVVGFTQKVERKNEEIGTGSAYTNFFQNIGKRDNLNPDNANDKAINFIKIVYEKMLDNNISKDIVYKESRVGKDTLFTEEFSDGRDLNNRIDIAIYVKSILDPDTDEDGVRDSKDYCPATPIGASVDKNGCPLVMKLDLLFDFDKATISDEKSIQNVQRLSDFMKAYPRYHANIVGHTDNEGSDVYNKELSLKRAEVVAKLILTDGIKVERLSYEGRGESEPLFENINPFNRHQNRRTEVELTLPVEKAHRSEIVPRSRGTVD